MSNARLYKRTVEDARPYKPSPAEKGDRYAVDEESICEQIKREGIGLQTVEDARPYTSSPAEPPLCKGRGTAKWWKGCQMRTARGVRQRSVHCIKKPHLRGGD